MGVELCFLWVWNYVYVLGMELCFLCFSRTNLEQFGLGLGFKPALSHDPLKIVSYVLLISPKSSSRKHTKMPFCLSFYWSDYSQSMLVLTNI